MKRGIIFQIINLIRNKHSNWEKIYYVLISLIFIFPLIIEQKRGKKENDDELQGDDIYPLF